MYSRDATHRQTAVLLHFDQVVFVFHDNYIPKVWTSNSWQIELDIEGVYCGSVVFYWRRLTSFNCYRYLVARVDALEKGANGLRCKMSVLESFC